MAPLVASHFGFRSVGFVGCEIVNKTRKSNPITKKIITHYTHPAKFYAICDEMKLYKYFRNREIDPICSNSFKLQLIDERINSLEASWRHAIPLNGRTNAGTSAMAFDNAESRFLLCGNSKGDVTIVDFHSSTNYNSSLETYPQNHRIIPTRSSHQFMVNGCEWYPVDSSIFLTSGMDKTLKIWDATQLIPIEEFKFVQPISNFNWMVSNVNSSSLIALAISSSNVLMLDPRTGNSAHQIRAQNQRIWSVRWIPSANYILATGSDQGFITLWDIRSGKSELKKIRSPGGIEALNCTNNRKRTHSNTNLAHTNRINCLQSSNDGRFLISLTHDRNISLWEAKTLKLLCWMKIQEENSISTIPTKFEICDEGRSLWAFVPLGNKVAIVNFKYPFMNDGKQIMNCGNNIRQLHGHFQNVISCAYRKNHQQLISSSTDRFNLIWAPKMDELQFDSAAQNIQQLHEDAFSDDEN